MNKQLLFCALISLTGTGAERGTQLTADGQSFEAFIVKHGRSYLNGTEEYEIRRALYHRRLEEMREQNSRPGRLWTAGINHLSDWTDFELTKLRGLRKIVTQRSAGAVLPHAPESTGKFLAQVNKIVMPKSKSWDHLKSLQQSTDQASCGSCWAVATANVLRANSEISGRDRTYSAQELVSCAPNPHKCGGDGGCGGSTVELAMAYTMEYGLDTAEGTKYEGQTGICKKTVEAEPPVYLLQGHDVDDDDSQASLEEMIKVGFHGPKSAESPGALIGLRGWTRLQENKYQPLLEALLEGPVASSIDASGWSSYSSGIYDNCMKDAVIDHAVTIAGFGVADDGTKFWQIKNSWGNGWGEKGFMRLIRREEESYCGVDKHPEVGTGCEGGPKEVNVCGSCGVLYDNVAIHFHPKM